LLKFPTSLSTATAPKDGRNTAFLFRCPSFFPGMKNILL
jgi:hypothetical protein